MTEQILPCTPPLKKKPDWAKLFFFIGTVSSVFIFFFKKEKGDFVGGVRARTPQNAYFCHNHSNPISNQVNII